jgi:hypothetical protein
LAQASERPTPAGTIAEHPAANPANAREGTAANPAIGHPREAAHPIGIAAAALAAREGRTTGSLDNRAQRAAEAAIGQPPEDINALRQRVTNFEPKEVPREFQRPGYVHDGSQFAQERTRFLEQMRAAGREREGLQALDGLQARLGPDAANPLDFHRAASMLHTLNDGLRTPAGQLCPGMGDKAHEEVVNRTLAYVNNVAHCRGNDTSIFQHIGSCGVMGTIVDGANQAPEQLAKVLVAGFQAQPAGTMPDGQQRYAAHFRNSQGQDVNFFVNDSFMQHIPGTARGEQAAMQLHGSLGNIMWNAKGGEYSLGAVTSHGESGARLTDMQTGEVYDTTPHTTLKALDTLDKKLAMGTVRLFSEPPHTVAGLHLGPNMVNLYGMSESAARQRVNEAFTQGGGTIELVGNGAKLLGLNRAGRDSYHNTTVSFDPRRTAGPGQSQYILTDTNRGLSDDNYGARVAGGPVNGLDGMGLILAGVTDDSHYRAYSDEYRRNHPDRGRGVPDLPDGDPDFNGGMNKNKDDKLAKNDDDQRPKKHKGEEDLYAEALQRRNHAIQLIADLRAAHDANNEKGEFRAPGDLERDANLNVDQYV